MIEADRFIRFIVLMGVAGSGKTTIGRLFAERTGWDFFDGDDYHSPANIRKMGRGIPLTDTDRAGWLDQLAALIQSRLMLGKPGILACSALKQSYRDVLNVTADTVLFVFLKGDRDLITARVEERSGHYMKPDMIDSQFATLEEPGDALVIDIAQSPEQIVQILMETLRLDAGAGSSRT